MASSVSETRMVSPMPSANNEPMPMALLMRPSSPSPARAVLESLAEAGLDAAAPQRGGQFGRRPQRDEHPRHGRCRAYFAASATAFCSTTASGLLTLRLNTMSSGVAGLP